MDPELADQIYELDRCIECGCCSYVCPSRIPLVQYFRFAKSEIWAREREKNAADQAKTRFEFKQYREEREKADKAEKLAKAAAAQAAKKAAEAAAAAAESSAAPAADGAIAPAVAAPADVPAATVNPEKEAKRATIEAAMARAKAQREAVQPKNTESLTPDQQKAAADIEARRVAAHLIEPEPVAPAPASEKPE